MLTVGIDAADVEARLSSASLACPECGAALAPWGHGRPRWIRSTGGVRWRLRPRRARCSGCGITHVLLPVTCLVRRADAVAVIGAALAHAAAGWGHRRIAETLGRPASTVRGWLRRFSARAGPIRWVFTALLCAVDPAPTMPDPASSAVADAVAAVVATARAAAARWGRSVVTSPWQLAAAVTSGCLLTPDPTAQC